MSRLTKVLIILNFLTSAIFLFLVFNKNTPILLIANSDYIFTAIATSATLCGISFAIYGWYSSYRIKLMYKEINDKILHYQNENYRMQEALQKMNVVYSIKDADEKISLINEIIKIYPKTFNVYETLAYTYWYDKEDLDSAKEYFLQAFAQIDNNYRAACDLAVLYATQNNKRLAFKWIKTALKIDSNCADYFNNDNRLTIFLKTNENEYEKLKKQFE